MLRAHVELREGAPVFQHFVHCRGKIRLKPVKTLLLVGSVRPVCSDQALVVEKGENALSSGQVDAWHLVMARVYDQEWILVRFAKLKIFP